jgi:hypothetical protein
MVPLLIIGFYCFAAAMDYTYDIKRIEHKTEKKHMF